MRDKDVIYFKTCALFVAVFHVLIYLQLAIINMNISHVVKALGVLAGKEP